jgi:hypothetical protein
MKQGVAKSLTRSVRDLYLHVHQFNQEFVMSATVGLGIFASSLFTGTSEERFDAGLSALTNPQGIQ